MQRIFAALLALICISVIASPASAKRHSHKFHHQKQIHFSQHRFIAGAERDNIVSHPSGCPRTAFCGCGVSVKVFGHPVRDLFLASNWFKFPRTHAAPGMVAVRNHHVMYIISADANGNATVYDPNSGRHQTRIHEVSLSGYRVVNPTSYGRAATINTQHGPRDIGASI